MTTSRRFSFRRGASALIAAGLLFVLSGDRGVTAVPPGIDPLEVLDLQVKPNVIIVLDSSGSMSESLTGTNINGLSGADWSRSKISQAKQVLNQVITANDTKAAFQFGQYTQANSAMTSGELAIGGTRFVYETESWAAVGALPVEGPGASLVTTNLTVQGGGGEGALMAFQTITANNNSIIWRERTVNGSTAPFTFVTCSVTLPIGFTALNAGTAIAATITTQMNACVRPATAGANVKNTYSVTYATGANPRFTFARTAGNRNWNIMFGTGGANQAHRIMGFNAADLPNPLAAAGSTTNSIASSFNCPRVLRRATTNVAAVGTFDPDGPTCPATGPQPVPCGPSPARAVTTYSLLAGKFWNGETVAVQTNGVVCSVTAGAPTSPPTVKLQQVATPCGATSGQPVTFKWAGTDFGGNNISCNGFQAKVPLRPCDQITPLQITQVSGFLNRSIRLNGTEANPLSSNYGLDEGTSLLDYSEANDGSGFITSLPAPLHPALSAGGLAGGGIPADGLTPIGNSLRDIRGTAGDPAGSVQRNWTQLWYSGQAAAAGPPAVPALSAISSHTNPKERTIVLFITDGDDTCGPNGGGDTDALVAAYQAQLLYDPLVGGVQTPSGRFTAGSDPASSVQTYLVAFGSGASATRSNWIAWGGSGMVLPTSGSGASTQWAAAPTAAQRTLCATCKDAYIAPDADTLRQALEAVINQGASQGEFTAQSSVAENVYELVAQAAPRDLDGAGPLPPGDPLSPLNADNRDAGAVIMRFISTFTLPTYDGQFRGYTNNGTGTAIEQWNAGQLLTNRVTTGMTACVSSGTAGECMFSELHGGATPENIALSTAARIKRRVYTSSRNGVFVGSGANEINPANLTNAGWVQTQGTGGFRVALWPPTTAAGGVAPNGSGAGSLDVPLGLPSTTTATDFTNLQLQFNACHGAISSGQVDATGSGHPCSASNSATVRAQQARREAREMILAYTAGAEVVLDSVTAFPKRILSGANAGQILYKARGWVLGESTLATPAVVSPPLDDLSTPCKTVANCPFITSGTTTGLEYDYYINGIRNTAGITTSTADQGFGLTNPDDDKNLPPAVPPATTRGEDSRTAVKPVMTVVYVGANDMLHAFRAGPSIRSIGAAGSAAGSYTNVCVRSATVECGGEELWGFVPYDQLGKLRGRMAIPQRDPHTYMIAASIRFADIFVPVAGGGTFTPTAAASPIKGVWRKVIFFGRGIGGKYLTALDVSAPGPFTRLSLETNGPLVMWNRGNPDTQNGITGGPANNTTAAGASDALAYTKMGQTWSVPAIALVTVPGTKNYTTRRPLPEGTPFVAYVGSGYGTSPEGTVFYTLDALTGDIVTTADVESAAALAGLSRTTAITSKYPNALVANPAAFSAPAVSKGASTAGAHPSGEPVTRVYMGDLYGRVWKFLSVDSSVAIPLADLGEDQPVAAPAALLNLTDSGAVSPAKPYVFVESGQENRLKVPAPPSGFKIFSLIDDNASETDLTQPTTTTSAINFSRVFELNYRGTSQPTTVFSDDTAGGQRGRVFFVGTRFNEPGSVFAPPPYPCRSSFDSILYLLGAKSGLAAFDLNTSGDDSFLEYEDSRLNGIQVVANPALGGTGGTVVLDEGQVVSGTPPQAGPPPGPMVQVVPVSIVTRAPLSSSAVCK